MSQLEWLHDQGEALHEIFHHLQRNIWENTTVIGQNLTTNGTTNGNQELVPEWFGWISVVVCIFCWGLFGIPLKVKWVQQANMHPIIFQFYFSMMVFVSSFIVLIWNEWYFSYWGFLGAGCWVPCSLLSLVAVKKLGLGIAQGVWSGSTILTSFVWGLIFKSKIGKYYLTAVGLFLMIIGIVGVATCSKWNIAEVVIVESKSENEETEVPEEVNADEKEKQVEEEQVENPIPQPPKKEEKVSLTNTDLELTRKEKIIKLVINSKDYVIGLLCAIGVGLLGGSMFVAVKLEEHKGVAYVIGFGTGAICITSVILIVFLIYHGIRFRELAPFHIKVAVFPLITASLWQIGNVFGFYVTMSSLGMTVGLPLTQTSLVLAGFVGLVIFKELKGWKAITQFFVAALVFLIPGCLLLALFGKE